jgi:rhodanese-related sulfurtransferase
LRLSVTVMGLLGLFGSVPKVSAAEARQLVDGGAVLLDVREKSEWNAGHAPQAAHLPLGRIDEAGRKVKQGRRVVVMCRSGNRSRSATKSLISMGYDAVNLSGGIGAWQRAGGAVVDRSGRRA